MVSLMIFKKRSLINIEMSWSLIMVVSSGLKKAGNSFIVIKPSKPVKKTELWTDNENGEMFTSRL